MSALLGGRVPQGQSPESQKYYNEYCCRNPGETPKAGEIPDDYANAAQMVLDQIRSQLAVVNQDTYLFHGTIEDNLRFGKPDATQLELEEAARVASP